MTNTLMLEMAIRRAGLIKKEIAKLLGLSAMDLHKKVNNITEFKASKITRLYNLLNLSSLEEQQKIFLPVVFTVNHQIIVT